MARRSKRSRDAFKAETLAQDVLLTVPWAAARCTLETVEKFLRQLCEPGGGLPAEYHGRIARARADIRHVYAHIVHRDDTLGWDEAFGLARLGRDGQELPTLHTGVTGSPD
jgi:hypothetical protein